MAADCCAWEPYVASAAPYFAGHDGLDAFSSPSIYCAGTHESTYYGEPSPEDDYFHKDDRLVRMAQIAPKKGATFLYEYDFGDSWKHEITVEEISATPKDEPPYPWCLDGQKALFSV
jgi:hypothetical protein